MSRRSLVTVLAVAASCCLLFSDASVVADSVEIVGTATANTSQAVIHGLLIRADRNGTTASFFGVPFAQPPVGKLRFAAPRPWEASSKAAAESDDDQSDGLDVVNAFEAADSDRGGHVAFQVAAERQVIFANETRPACLQVSSNSTDDVPQSEDCLYLNIHSPVVGSWPESASLRHPVVAWLHDGFLETGTLSNPNRPLGWDLVVQEKVVLTEIAYRLGVFGFLRLPGANMSGNWGLLDQQIALTWIRDNIGAFGGDSSSVTLAGVGAGAASAGLHLFSFGSASLFHRVALMGGGPLSPWLFVPNSADADQVAADFIERSGCRQQGSNATEVAVCLRRTDAATLAAQLPHPGRPLDIAAFPVVVDGHFIVAGPVSTAKLTAKPALVGVTDREGELSLIERLNTSDLTGAAYRKVLESAFRYYPRYPRQLGLLGRRLVAGSLTAFPSSAAALRNRGLLSDGLALWYTVCPANRFVDALVNGSNETMPTHVYQFAEPRDSGSGSDGAGHGQDAFFFLGGPVRAGNHTEEQKKLSLRMMFEFATFARKGRTTDVWLPATADELEFFRFSTSASPAAGPQTGGISRQDCLFWEQQLAWVNQLDDGSGGRTTASPDDGESKFWERCNRTLNAISIATIAAGGSLCLLLAISLVAVACSKRRQRRRSSDSSAALEMQASRYTVAPSPRGNGGSDGANGRRKPRDRTGRRVH